MSDLKNVGHGWEFMTKMVGTDLSSRTALSDYMRNTTHNNAILLRNKRIQKINEAITQLEKNINEHPHVNLDVEQFKGFVAEEMHAGTFNINAIRQGSDHRAWALHDNGYATVDVETNFNKSYSLKYSNTAKDAENMQAALNTDTRTPKYHGQERLISSEQVDEAKIWAHKRALKDLENRPDVAKSHVETQQHLVGKISDGEGIESKELTIKESKQIAREAKNGRFRSDAHGYAKSPLLDTSRINYINQAIKAGLTAAAISTITQIVPELYKAIDYLIKHGEIDTEGIRKSGNKVMSASGESFLKGAIAYGVEMAILEGLLGETIKQVSPSVIGVAVTVILSTIKDSILVAAGKITVEEMGIKFFDAMVVSSGYLVSMQIGGAIAQALCPELPGIGYALGSLLGCSLAVLYDIGKNKLISFCVDTGFACFDLVKQDYKLPEEMLKKMGVHSIPVLRAEVSRVHVNRASVTVQKASAGYETVAFTGVRRGVIGIKRIGYVIS